MTSSAPLRIRAIPQPAYAAAGLAVAFAVIVLGNVNVPAGENGGTGPALFTGVLCTVVLVGLFAGLLPRLAGTERAAAVLGALAVASILVFWSGLPPVFAAAAAAALSRADRPGPAARLLTALAAVATIVAVCVTIASSHLF